MQVHNLDINTCSIKDTEFESEFQLKAESTGSLTSIAGYFDTFFDDATLENRVVLPTGPQATPTHWKQAVFFLQEKLQVVEGQTFKGSIKVERSPANIRGIKVTLTIEGKSQIFSID